MTTVSPLIGPPSLRAAEATAIGTAISTITITQETLPVDPIADDDGPVFNSDDEKPIMGFTETMSATFLSTGNPCLDFFFQVVPGTPPEKLIGLLQIAWAFNPLNTLKLICNLRGVRGTGKSDKEGFYTAALWLYDVHPKTLAGNVKAIAEFGYFKDFLEILYRIIEGPCVRTTQKEERMLKNRRRRSKRRRRHFHGIDEESVDEFEYPDYIEDPSVDENEEINLGLIEEIEDQNISENEDKKEEEKIAVVNEGRNEGNSENEYQSVEKHEVGGNGTKENAEKEKKEKVVKTPEDIKRLKDEARALRKEKERNQAKKALEIYNGDEDYRLLHDSVSSFFVELLKDDIEKMKSGKLNEISLAAKWCPTIDSSYDKATLICESIARKLFPREKYPEYVGLEEGHYAYRVRDRLRKEVLVPLHRALELPEVYMSANNWNTLPYNRVPSVAMKKYQKFFSAHDTERFQKYLDDVKSGKAKIAAGALLPHEIIGAVRDDDGREVAELQWKRLVDDMTQKGKLSNCIAVSDVSGSMSGIPMEVSVALGVLVSELSEEPWKGKLITFSEFPEIQKVEGNSLFEKTEFVRNMSWGMSTNFQGVFDRILEVAVEGKLKEEEMLKRVFVFSDMEFNEASTNPWETDYKVIQRKYAENGYTNVPEIVFWNLRDSRSVPVAGKEGGVALVSGYSKNMLNIFIDGGGIVNPVEVMEVAIAGEEYKKLTVVD